MTHELFEKGLDPATKTWNDFERWRSIGLDRILAEPPQL